MNVPNNVTDPDHYFDHLLSSISPIVTFDSEMRIRFMNSSFAEEFRQKGDILGRQITDVLKLKGRNKTHFVAQLQGNEEVLSSEFKSGKKIFGFTMFHIEDHTGMILKDITEKKKLESRIKKLHSQLLELQEKERQKIASELHDGVGQTILAAKLNFISYINDPARQMDKFEKGLNLIDLVSQELRELYTSLYPSVLKDLGLEAAIRSFVKNYKPENISFAAYFNLTGKIPHEIEVNIYRITQELVSNAIKHSGASEISLELVREKNRIHLEFNDNGCGFDLKEIRLRQKGFGLENIKRRVDDIGGKLIIDSTREGSSIIIELPL